MKKKLNIPFEFPFEIIKKAPEDAGEGNWYVEGFAGSTDFDLQSDIITEDAFKKAEKDLIECSTVLFNHDQDQPIGRVIDTDARENGLWVKVLISKTVPNIWKKIQEGIISKFSIRGEVIDAIKKYVKDIGKMANVILEMHLIECSLVSLPANPSAKTTRWYIAKALRDFEVKGGELPLMKLKNIEEVLETCENLKERMDGTDKDIINAVKSFVETFKKNTDADNTPLKASGEPWTQEEVDNLAKDLEELKTKVESARETKIPVKESGEAYTQEEIDRLVGDLEEAKKSGDEKKDNNMKNDNSAEAPKKASGEAYTQEEIDVMAKELERLTNENVAQNEKLNDIQVSAEVEKKWNEIKDGYDEKSADNIRLILKKSIKSEPLSLEEIDLFIKGKKIDEQDTMLLTPITAIDIKKNSMTSDRKAELIKIAKIKVPKKNQDE